MEIYNPKFTADGAIDCEIDHPRLGRIPFTARQDDQELVGALVYAEAAKLKPTPYVKPVPTKAQIDLGLDEMADTLVTGSMKDRAIGLLFADLWAVANPAAKNPLQSVRDRFRAHLATIYNG